MKQINLPLIGLFFSLIFSLPSFAKSAQAKALACPQGGKAPETYRQVPYRKFQMSKKDTLLICVASSSSKADKYLTQYNGYLFSKGQTQGKRVLTGTYNIPVQFEFKKGDLYEVMHLKLRESYLPLFKEKIACRKNHCQRSQKVCVYNQNKLSPPSPSELNREKIIFSKGVARVQEMTESDLKQMANLALAGRKTAFEFFNLEDEPILLGSAKQFYKNMQTLLRQIQSEGRLKLVAAK
jgi:hypothetical protein